MYQSKVGFDPLLKIPESGGKSECKVVPKMQAFLGYSQEFKAWVGPFVMAMVMCNCVRRSNVINRYGDKLVYK